MWVSDTKNWFLFRCVLFHFVFTIFIYLFCCNIILYVIQSCKTVAMNPFIFLYYFYFYFIVKFHYCSLYVYIEIWNRLIVHRIHTLWTLLNFNLDEIYSLKVSFKELKINLIIKKLNSKLKKLCLISEAHFIRNYSTHIKSKFAIYENHFHIEFWSTFRTDIKFKIEADLVERCSFIIFFYFVVEYRFGKRNGI